MTTPTYITEFAFADNVEPASVAAVFVEVDDTTKLSDGAMFKVSSYVSFDGGDTWLFVNGSTWQSFGTQGMTVIAPDGEKFVNPGPNVTSVHSGKEKGVFKLRVEQQDAKARVDVTASIAVKGGGK